jgi:hypothetical protein
MVQVSLNSCLEAGQVKTEVRNMFKKFFLVLLTFTTMMLASCGSYETSPVKSTPVPSPIYSNYVLIPGDQLSPGLSAAPLP